MVDKDAPHSLAGWVVWLIRMRCMVWLVCLFGSEDVPFKSTFFALMVICKRLVVLLL